MGEGDGTHTSASNRSDPTFTLKSHHYQLSLRLQPSLPTPASSTRPKDLPLTSSSIPHTSSSLRSSRRLVLPSPPSPPLTHTSTNMVCPFSLLSLLPTLVLSAVLATAASLPPLHNNGLAPLEERGHVEPVALVAPAINPPVAPVAPVNVAPVAPVASVLKNDDNKVGEHRTN